MVASNKKHTSRRGPGKATKKSTVLKSNFVETRIREYKDEPFRKSTTQAVLRGLSGRAIREGKHNQETY